MLKYRPRALPILPGTRSKRVLTGDAVTTVGGDLAARYVIHAVGPNYRVWIGKRPSHEREAAATAADMALRRAYDASMREAKRKGMASVGFSLLSAGIFRGPRSVEEVLRIGVHALAAGSYAGLEHVCMGGYTAQEAGILEDLLDELDEALHG